MSAFLWECALSYMDLQRKKSSLGGDLLGVFFMALAVVPLGQAPSLAGSITPHPHEERDSLIFCFPSKPPVHGVSLETLGWVVFPTGVACCGQTSLDLGNFYLIGFTAS